jgi:hypothetical protein
MAIFIGRSAHVLNIYSRVHRVPVLGDQTWESQLVSQSVSHAAYSTFIVRGHLYHEAKVCVAGR